MKKLKDFYLLIALLFMLSALAIFSIEGFSFFALSGVESNLKEERYRLEKLSDAEQNLASLELKYKEIEQDLTKIDTALPDQKNTSTLLSDLDWLAKDSSLKLTLLQSTTYGKKQAVPSDPGLLQTIQGKYGYEMPLEIKVEGSYAGFVTFIKKVENYRRLLNVSSVEINKVKKTGAAPDLIEAKIKLTGYLKK